MKSLLCTDGSVHGQAALRFGAMIALHAKDPATLLGVVEPSLDLDLLEKALEEGRQLLEGAPSPHLRIRVGNAAEKILEEVNQGDYDMLVIGTRGRRGISRFFVGSTSERVVNLAPLPVLLVPKYRQAIRRILICTSGTELGLATVEMGGRVARLMGAQVMVLHVMSQVSVALRAKEKQLEDLEASAKALMDRHTYEGEHLHQALEMLKEMGIDAQANIRHGLVLDEIMNELQDGDYDLAVVGEHAAAGRMRYLFDDITQHIIEKIDRPILIGHNPLSISQE